MKILKRRALFLGLLLLPACGGQLVEFKKDAGRDTVVATDVNPSDVNPTDVSRTDTAMDVVATDVNIDAGVDTPDALNLDVRLDVPADVTVDLALDVRLDVLPDAAVDVTLDVPVDVAVDASLDVAVDATLDVALDVAIDVPLDTIPDVTIDVDIDLGGPDGPCRQLPVVLGADLENYAVLAGQTVTNTGNTVVTGDLGVSPGTGIVGFGPGVVVGIQHPGDTAAGLAQGNLTTAYDDAAGRVNCPISRIGNLGGMTLPPGLYKSTGFMEISSGNLVLDALGDPNAIFIFQIVSSLNTATGTQVLLQGGATPAMIYWQVGSSATLHGMSFQGTIIALTSISLDIGSTLNGRALARNGSVTMNGNIVTRPPP